MQQLLKRSCFWIMHLPLKIPLKLNRICRHVKFCFRFAKTIELEPSQAHQNPFKYFITNSRAHLCMLVWSTDVQLSSTIVLLQANLLFCVLCDSQCAIKTISFHHHTRNSHFGPVICIGFVTAVL